MSDDDLLPALLYCDEELGDLVQSETDRSIPIQEFSDADEWYITRLLDSEPDHMPGPDYVQRCRDQSVDVTSRLDSIKWMLKVHAYYQFKPVTAFLSVNYLDRYLSSGSLPEYDWAIQMLSVACISLAAKMEEFDAPSLLDLQLVEPRLVFEPKTLQRMELRVMATLKWRLHSVTPFDYLRYFISKLPCIESKPDSFRAIFSASSDLLINTTRVTDFLGFQPSIMAAAAVLSAASVTVDSTPESFFERVDEGRVRSCHQLMEEYLIDTCPSSSGAPPSPVGVLDAAACASCDTRSENPGPDSGPGDTQPEPDNKRPRLSTTDVHEPQP